MFLLIVNDHVLLRPQEQQSSPVQCALSACLAGQTWCMTCKAGWIPTNHAFCRTIMLQCAHYCLYFWGKFEEHFYGQKLGSCSCWQNTKKLLANTKNRSGLVDTFITHANMKGLYLASLVCSLLLLYASSVKNKNKKALTRQKYDLLLIEYILSN